jgi:tetratricopeptide (TPR) repeat protein
MKRMIISALAIISFISLTFIGCGQQSSPPPPPSQAQAPVAPVELPGQPSLKVTQQQGMVENANAKFSDAIKDGPTNSTAYSDRAVTYMWQKNYNLAIADLNKAKELTPNDPAIRYNLASCHSIMGNVDLGFVELDAALANGFNDYDTLRKDPDLANLRKSRDWRKTLEKYKVSIN